MRLLFLLLAALPALLLLACGGDDGEGGEVNVTLREWEVVTDVETLPEGDIQFDVKNDGEREHELVIVKTDIPGAELPTNDDGTFDEDAAGVDVEREIEDIGDGDETSRTYTIDPGKYIFLCNLKSDVDGEETSHFAEGMWTEFEVTEDSGD